LLDTKLYFDGVAFMDLTKARNEKVAARNSRHPIEWAHFQQSLESAIAIGSKTELNMSSVRAKCDGDDTKVISIAVVHLDDLRESLMVVSHGVRARCLTISSPMAAQRKRWGYQSALWGRHSVQRMVRRFSLCGAS
jgi:hypothetical protein